MINVPPVDRRAVLIELAKNGQLTPERSMFVRMYHDIAIRKALKDWNVHPDVHVVATPSTLAISATTPYIGDIEVQRLVDTHCMLLGIETVPISWTNPEDTHTLQLSPSWELQLHAISRHWEHPGFPRRIARFLALSDQPAWQPLITLMEHGLHPYGINANGTHFIISDPQNRRTITSTSTAVKVKK